MKENRKLDSLSSVGVLYIGMVLLFILGIIAVFATTMSISDYMGGYGWDCKNELADSS